MLPHPEDNVCFERARLVTEAYRAHEGLAAPLLRARAFERVLAGMTLDVTSNPIVVGNTSASPGSWMLVPEFGFAQDRQIEIEHPELAGFLEGRIPADLEEFWRSRSFGGSGGIGHMSVDFDFVVNKGLEDALRRLRAGRYHSEREPYRQAMEISVGAVIGWASRLADEAERASRFADEPAAGALRRVAAACRHVPAKPARSFFEGVQAIALVHIATVLEGQGLSISIGLPDRALSRFAAEVEEEFDEAVSILSAFLRRVAANSFQGRGSKTQAITVGGRGAKGTGAETVARAFLEAFAATPVADPHLFLRWTEGLDDGLWDRAMTMISSGRSMPMVVNDAAVVPGLVAAGVTTEDALDYCIVGCNELGIPGRLCQSGFSLGLGFNDLEVVDRSVRSVAGAEPTIEGARSAIEAILADYEERVVAFARRGVKRRRTAVAEHVATVPFPFTSACCADCVESGTDYLVGMPYPDIYGVFIRGTTNAVNVLSAVATAGKGATLSELLRRFDAEESEVAAACAASPRWGADDERADSLGLALNQARNRALRRVAEEVGLPPFAVCHVVRSLHHVDGARIGRTLDGRAPGSAVADSVGPAAGTTGGGPTAVLNSVLKLRAAEWFTGIYNLNITLPGGAEASVVSALALAFFGRGGQELQFNVLDLDTLRAALADPNSHRDLVVRVAGLNARFVDLSPIEQEELVGRAEAAVR